MRLDMSLIGCVAPESLKGVSAVAQQWMSVAQSIAPELNACCGSSDASLGVERVDIGRGERVVAGHSCFVDICEEKETP